MADSDSKKGDNIKGSSSSSSPQEEKNKNNGKQLADFPLNMPMHPPPTSLTEFPRYEYLKEKNSEAMMKLCSSKADRTEKRGAKGSFKEEEWNDPIVLELGQLLSHYLGATFRGVIKKIVECGYTEEVAEWAVLRSGVYSGLKDAESNIVDGALAYLKNEKETDAKKVHVFENLQSVASHTMLEMVSVLRKMRLDLSVAEAVWYLLICDSNMSVLCSAKVDPSMVEVILGDGFDSKSKPYDKNACEKPPLPNLQFGHVAFDPNSVTQTTVTEEKPGGSRKGASISKRDMLKQKTLLFEKNYKGRMLKGALKAKVTTLENLVLENKLTSQSESSNTGANVSINNPNTKGDTISEEKQSQDSSSKNLDDYYAKIPYDESMGQHVPQDERDQVLMWLLNQMKETEKERENWTKWANEKVMQAARRLGKDQKELKKLRADKEAAENFLSDKRASEENTVKRLAEMEQALANTGGLIEMAKAAATRLEEENRVLKKAMTDKRMEAIASCEKAKEAEFREQELLKKVQKWEKMKSSFIEDLIKMKARKKGVQCNLDLDKARLKQEAARKAQIVKEKERLLKLAETIPSKREQMIAAAKIDDEVAIQKAENYKKKTKEEIKKLEAQISELRMKAEVEEITELRKSVSLSLGNRASNGPELWGNSVPKVLKRLAVFADNFGEADDEYECVMCLNDERTVVFLPCLHQVLCVKCNELHEKQGMKECPACRTKIKRRIPGIFAGQQ